MQFFEFAPDLLDREALQVSAAPHLPAFLSERGVFPDLKPMLPGAVVLFAPRRPGVGQRLIIESQKRKVSAKHAQWTHVGIYIGDGYVCEAMPEGVIIGNVYSKLQTQRIRFRYHAKISREQSYVVAIKALLRRGDRYGWRRIAAHVKTYLRGHDLLPRSGISRLAEESRHVCSTLCHEAIYQATRLPCFSHPVDSPSPCDYSISNELVDHDHNWLSFVD
ncbi:hypothetical protein [Paracoccus luteus]|uniref:hypothetical protein n=1 Tax=Paracoccus luteus TaxID=2508543 RepID=UPI00106FEAC2|nr:hypothetical protein [Paracoccus luteus]